MKKSLKTILSITILSLVGAGYAFAAEGKTENTVAKCCAKAKADGKTCSHACCVEAAKEGKNCTKCGGSGTIQTEGKKKKKKKES